MAMNMAGSSGGGGRRGRRRAAVMAEINVTPMVDVMLVLLIIFMVSAPLLTVEHAARSAADPGARAWSRTRRRCSSRSIPGARCSSTIPKSRWQRPDTQIKAITEARGGMDERIYLRADKKADYGTVAKVMGQLSGAGFKRLALVDRSGAGVLKRSEGQGRQDTGCVDCPARPRDRVGTGVVLDQGVRNAAGRIPCRSISSPPISSPRSPPA